MEITEVRVKLMEEPGERLQAFCSITFDDAFVVRDLKIIEGTTGPFVAMPSRKLTGPLPAMRLQESPPRRLLQPVRQRLREQRRLKDDDGRAKLYADIAHPINSACREMIQQRVILAFQEEKARAKLPGYVPSYDDFEQEEPLGPRRRRRRARPPSRRRRSRRRRNPAAPTKCPPRSPRTAAPAASAPASSEYAPAAKRSPGKGDWLRRESPRPAAENALPRRCLSPFLGGAPDAVEKRDRHLAAIGASPPFRLP